MRENSVQYSSWLFDEPITDKSEDEYQRAEYTQNLADALLNNTDSHGLIIGIHGPWGSGKTSLKNLLINALKASENVNGCHIIKFEPWMYSGSGQVVSLLFKQIAQTLSGKTNFLYRAVLRLATISDFWNPLISTLFKAFSPAYSYSINLIASFFNNIGNYLAPDSKDLKVLAEQRRKLKRKLNATKTRIIVFIDDLDRLTDSEIAAMLRAVKAVGDLPYVTYVLLYDRYVVAKSLDKTCHNKGDEYLEKIIQVPIGLPEPPKEVVERMLTSEIHRIMQSDRRETTALKSLDSSSISFIDINQTCIAPYVNNLRDAIRLTNEFKIRYQVLKDDVEPGDLLGITSLEIFRPSLYRWIIEHKNLLCSHYEPSTLTPRLPTETAIEHLSDRLKELLDNMASDNQEAGKQDIEAVKALFPFAKASTLGFGSQNNISLSYLDPNGADRHIFRPEHFDAYFRLSIEQYSLHESEYKQFLLYDALSPADLDNHHWNIFHNTLFAGKAGKYLGNSHNDRAAKLIEFCFDLEEKYNNVDQGYMTLKVVLKILNAGDKYPDYEALFDTVTQQILNSESPLSLLLCAYLASIIRIELWTENSDKKTDKQIEYLSSKLQYISTPAFPVRAKESKNNLNILCSKFRDRLKIWKFKSSVKPLSGKVVSIYANSIPALFSKYDELYKAFIVFSHVVDKAHFVMFTLDALVHKIDGDYIMNFPLLQQLVSADAYQVAITKLIYDVSLRNDISIIDIGSIAAYGILLKSDTPANSVSAKKVDLVLKEWKKQMKTNSDTDQLETYYL